MKSQDQSNEKSNIQERSLVDFLNEKFQNEFSQEKSKIKAAINSCTPDKQTEEPEMNIDDAVDHLSSLSPETPKAIVGADTPDLDQSDKTKEISIKHLDSDNFKRSSAIDELNVHSKWLENYLKKESDKATAENPAEENVDENTEQLSKILNEEENEGTHTPEGIDDSPIANQMGQFPMEWKDEEIPTPREPSQDRTINMDEYTHEIPVVVYSDNDDTSEDNQDGNICRGIQNAEDSEDSLNENNHVQVIDKDPAGDKQPLTQSENNTNNKSPNADLK